MIHSFDTENALKYGLNEAIILNNLIFWVNENKANGRNYHEISEKLYPELAGEYRTWTFNSVKAFQLLFPYLSSKQIRSSLDNLCDNEILIKGCYSSNGYDRTNWYAFRDEAFAFSDTMQLPYKAKGSATQGKSITDRKQSDIKTNNKTSFENFQFSDSEIKTDSDLKEKKGKEKSCVKKESEPIEVIPHPCVLNEEYGTWVEMHGDGELHNMLADFYKQNQTKYEGKMYEGFKAYWTAKVINGKDKGKELWRTQKTFSVAGRLATWSNNYKPQSNGINNNKQQQSAIDKAQEAMAILREQDATFFFAFFFF